MAIAEKDVFREIPLRYLGYANEIGEAFRSLVPVRVVNFSYLVASVYVISHAVSRGTIEWRNQKNNLNPESIGTVVKHDSLQPTLKTTMDTLLWQGLASIAIPGLVVNRTCVLSKVILNAIFQTRTNPLKRYSVTAIGLCIIPFIINPIDKSVDKLMDNFIRPIYLVNK